MAKDRAERQLPQPDQAETKDGVAAVHEFEDDDEPDFAEEHDSLTVGEDPLDAPAESDARG
jgi:hypothetical protein